jgi:dTDP-4-dehydrorhamnose reductase
MRTVCVTGGNGLLGMKLTDLASRSFRVFSADLQDGPFLELRNVEYVRTDIVDSEKVDSLLRRANPEAVFHTAAFTDVDGCEIHKEAAWSVNVTGTENMALACRRYGVRLIHLSTDYVFDGIAGPYSETDMPNPVSHYGRTKLESERIVRSLLPDALIARTMVLYGYARGARDNFVTWLVEALGRGTPVRIVTDQFGNPTLADDLARALLLLFEKNAVGIVHTAGGEWLNRFEFAVKTAEAFGLDASLITPTTSEAFKQPAPRPLRSGLKTDKIEREFGFRFSTAAEGLRQVRDLMARGGNGKSGRVASPSQTGHSPAGGHSG